MRYCLACHRMASSGPICSHCGRSFNGNLCGCGHLNPPGAQFCAQCGSTKLLQAASSLSFAWMPRLLLLVGLGYLGYRLMLGAHWGEGLHRQFSVIYEWLLWKIVVLGMVLGLGWLWGELFAPRVRRGIERIVGSLFLLLFRIVEAVFYWTTARRNARTWRKSQKMIFCDTQISLTCWQTKLQIC